MCGKINGKTEIARKRWTIPLNILNDFSEIAAQFQLRHHHTLWDITDSWILFLELFVSLNLHS